MKMKCKGIIKILVMIILGILMLNACSKNLENTPRIQNSTNLGSKSSSDWLAANSLSSSWSNAPTIGSYYEKPYRYNNGPSAVTYIPETDNFLIIRENMYWFCQNGSGVWTSYGYLSDIWGAAPSNGGEHPTSGITGLFNRDGGLVILKGTKYWIYNINNNTWGAYGDVSQTWAHAPSIDGDYPYSGYGPTAISYLANINKFLIIKNDKYWYMNGSSYVWEEHGYLSGLWYDASHPEGVYTLPTKNVTSIFYHNNAVTIIKNTYYWIRKSSLPEPDITPPNVNIIPPQNEGADQVITIVATDDKTVPMIDFYIDDKMLATSCSTSGLTRTCTFDNDYNNIKTDGTHTIKAIAIDQGRNQSVTTTQLNYRAISLTAYLRHKWNPTKQRYGYYVEVYTTGVETPQALDIHLWVEGEQTGEFADLSPILQGLAQSSTVYAQTHYNTKKIEFFYRNKTALGSWRPFVDLRAFITYAEGRVMSVREIYTHDDYYAGHETQKTVSSGYWVVQ